MNLPMKFHRPEKVRSPARRSMALRRAKVEVGAVWQEEAHSFACGLNEQLH